MKKHITQKKEIVINPNNLLWYLFTTMVAIIMKKLDIVFFPYLIVSLLVMSSHFEIVYKKDPIKLKSAIVFITFIGMIYTIIQG